MSKHTAPAPAHALTSSETETLRGLLVAERERVLGTRAHGMASVREAAEPGAERTDEARASLEQHEAIGVDAHERVLLQHLEGALRRMDAGTYGVSERSGEPLGFARLQAVPWARFTAAEQEELEEESRRVAR